jgi:hypothetical protein
MSDPDPEEDPRNQKLPRATPNPMIQYLGDELEMQKSVNSTFAKSKNLAFRNHQDSQKQQQITFN